MKHSPQPTYFISTVCLIPVQLLELTYIVVNRSHKPRCSGVLCGRNGWYRQRYVNSRMTAYDRDIIDFMKRMEEPSIMETTFARGRSRKEL